MVSAIVRHCLLLLCITSIHTAYAGVSAKLSRSNIEFNETVRLTITSDKAGLFNSPDAPDLSILNDQFDILGNQQSSQTSITNGKRVSYIQWIYELAPKTSGTLTIPAIQIDKEFTQALVLTVSEAQQPYANHSPFFMEASVSKPEIFVQEQTLLTIRISSSISLTNLQLEDIKIDNATLNQLNNTQYEKSINNIPYIVYEISYAVTPQRSGELTIPAFRAEGIQNDYNGFFGNGKKLRLQSNPIILNVKSIPNTLGNKAWLPAEDVQLHETWSDDPENIKVGDSITRNLRISAKGLNSKQLPTLSMESNAFLKVYADKPIENESATEQGINSEKTQTITLIATQAGRIDIPAMDIEWWDINNQRQMNARLDAVSIDIQSNTGVLSTDTPTNTTPLESRDEAIATKTMSAQATAPIQTTSTMLWQIATAFSTGLALLFALLWRRACKKPSLIMVNEPTTFHSTKTDALMQLKTACAKKDLFAIKSAVIEWAKIEFPNQAIHSLSNMQHCIHNKELQEKLRQLEKALYGSAQADANWNDIYTMIDAGYKNKSEANTPLPSLYPNN